MLDQVRITGLGVIDDAVVDLHPGLTVLTGETGAGKTMVVTGLGLLLGGRGDATLVRSGAARLRVEGVVELPPTHPALIRAEEAGADVGDGLVLVRTVGADGRSRAHVGGTAGPVGLLAELAEHLVAVHGQADQWRLRRTEEHRALLDRFGGGALAGALEAFRDRYAAHAHAAAELDRLRDLTADRDRELDLLTLGLERVEAVDPQPGEDEALRREDARLAHTEELRTAVGGAHDLLVGTDEPGPARSTRDLLAQARSALLGVHLDDPALGELATRIAELGHLVDDLAQDLAGYLADVDADPARLEWVQERRAEISRLTRQYGDDVAAVLAWAADAATRVAELTGADSRLAELTEQVDTLVAERAEAAAVLTQARRVAAERLATAVTGELAHLAMGKATVAVDVRPRGGFGPDGADEVELLLAANPGSPARSVTKAASGGELARVMLAIEVATAGPAGAIPTFVFDEVDAGVGGKAALDVGARLATLAQHAQVIVVTHLPQVAAHADRHLVVAKAADGQVTSTGVTAVEGEERVAELARMMAGSVTPAALDHARDLLAQVGRG